MLISAPAAGPLNLIGIIPPGVRVPAVVGHRIAVIVGPALMSARGVVHGAASIVVANALLFSGYRTILTGVYVAFGLPPPSAWEPWLIRLAIVAVAALWAADTSADATLFAPPRLLVASLSMAAISGSLIVTLMRKRTGILPGRQTVVLVSHGSARRGKRRLAPCGLSRRGDANGVAVATQAVNNDAQAGHVAHAEQDEAVFFLGVVGIGEGAAGVVGDGRLCHFEGQVDLPLMGCV